MEDITTNSFSIDKKLYWHILLKIYARKRWWLIIGGWCIASYFLFLPQKDTFITFYIYFAYLYPLAIVLQYYFYAFNKKNSIFFQERYFVCTQTHITAYMNDETQSSILYTSIIKIYNYKQAILLYISKNQFIIIQKTCFKHPDDEFELLDRIKQAKL